MDDSQHLRQLRDRFNAGERPKFVYFWGHQPSKNGVTAACFSQWFEAPFELGAVHYPTAEHYMMAEKAALFGDQATRAQILQAASPGAVKALGRQVRDFDEAIWQQHRYAIVVRANQAKFSQHPHLQRYLGQSDDRVLVEASPLDRIWGIGLAQDDERASDPNQWLGLNLLGFALMQVRNTTGALR